MKKFANSTLKKLLNISRTFYKICIHISFRQKFPKKNSQNINFAKETPLVFRVINISTEISQVFSFISFNFSVDFRRKPSVLVDFPLV